MMLLSGVWKVYHRYYGRDIISSMGRGGQYSIVCSSRSFQHSALHIHITYQGISLFCFCIKYVFTIYVEVTNSRGFEYTLSLSRVSREAPCQIRAVVSSIVQHIRALCCTGSPVMHALIQFLLPALLWLNECIVLLIFVIFTVLL